MSFEEDKTKLKGYLAIIEQLRKELGSGRYLPGDKLPSEKELCSRFSASRSSVREALAALAYAGIIEAHGGSGYYLIGNPPMRAKEESARCAAKIVVEVDESWNINIFRRLLAAGADSFIVHVDNQGQYSKELRAIRQAANDLRIPVPILAEVPSTQDNKDLVCQAVNANVDAVIIRPTLGPEELHSLRRAIEDQGFAIPAFSRLDSLENSATMLHIADGAILDTALVSSLARDSLGIMLRQGITLGKLMFLAVKAADLPAHGDKLGELATMAETMGFDGIIFSSAGISPNSLISSIHLLRTKLKEAEDHSHERRDHRPCKVVASPMANALCSTAMHAASAVKAAAIVIPSENGFTPRLLSKFRPAIPVLAVTPYSRVARQLKLTWGVWPLLSQRASRHDEALDAAVRTAVYAELIDDGDVITGVISASDVANAINSVTLTVVGDVILQGQGIGSNIVSGRVTIVKSLYDIKKPVTNKIVVIPATDASHIKLIEQAAALIVEEGGLSSHAAVSCLALGKPVIVGAAEATDLLLEDEQVTLDISRGMVYRGWVNLG